MNNRTIVFNIVTLVGKRTTCLDLILFLSVAACKPQITTASETIEPHQLTPTKVLFIMLRNQSTPSPDHEQQYRRIPKVTALVIFGFSRSKGPLLSGSRYFRAAATFGQLKNVCNSSIKK